MLRNKFKPYKALTIIASLIFASVFATPAEAKKKKKDKTQEVIESPVPTEEIEVAVEEIGFDPDSLFFADVDPDAIRKEALGAILPNYREWNTAMLNGKLRLQGLPISPSIKIFMQKGQKISISVRASIMGEVARIDLSGDSILAVNKMKRTYCLESIGNLRYDYPGLINDIQSLLLGRVVILQVGELTADNSEALDYAAGDPYDENSYWYLDFPKNRTETDDFTYRYTITSAGEISKMLVALAAGEHDYALNLDYKYSSRNRDMDITFCKDDTPKFSTRIAFDAVEWEAKPLSPIELTSKFTKLGIKDFIRSFKF